MRNAIRSTLATATLAAGLAAAPAQAAQPPTPQRGVLCAVSHICGDVYHVRAGAIRRIGVQCHSGRVEYLYRGQSSTCADVDRFYVYSGYELWDRIIIRGFPQWNKWADATGWHEVADSSNLNLKNLRD